MTAADPPIQPIPPGLSRDPEVLEFIQFQQRVIYDLWERTGGSDDEVQAISASTPEELNAVINEVRKSIRDAEILLVEALSNNAQLIAENQALGEAAFKGVTGEDANAVTGTAGSEGELLQWDANGDAIAKGVTGQDANAVTGTAGANGNLVEWNADGDAVNTTQLSALTAKDNSSVDATYGTEERDVIQNNRTRIEEIENRLTTKGIL